MVTIRKVIVNDADVLQHLCIDTFAETYTAYNTPENMQLYNETYFGKEQLQNEIIDKQNYFFIALADNEPAGYTKMRTTDEPPELKRRMHIEIERIYVLQKFQKQKIGLHLMNQCIETAMQHGFDVIWLGVWEQNTKAINFYTRRGFSIFGTHIFTLGTDPQTDWLMKMELVKPDW